MRLSSRGALGLAPHGITFNMVSPGPVHSGMFHGAIPAGGPKVAQIAASIPVKRPGQPAGVAHALRFFCAEQAGFVSGQVLYVCGGTSVGSLPLPSSTPTNTRAGASTGPSRRTTPRRSAVREREALGQRRCRQALVAAGQRARKAAAAQEDHRRQVQRI
ncbi:MAG TPA: SDR family oxidoreductase [Rubrivivax sp.]|nr:SDR family oxidoreductase [Rubrivivax sp.]